MALLLTAVAQWLSPVVVPDDTPITLTDDGQVCIDGIPQLAGLRLPPHARRGVESALQEKFRRRFLPDSSGGKRPPRPLRILSLDGGGVRGLYTARLLERLVEVIPDLLDHFDLLAGSSTGSLISLLLALGYSPKEVVQIYRISARSIFAFHPLRYWNPFSSKYSNKPMKAILRQIAAQTTFRDLTRYVLICAFCIDGVGDSKGVVRTFFSGGRRGWRPAIFTNLPRGYGQIEPDNLLEVVDAALRSTAAPTYFPIYQGYADGGIFANNPSLVALTRSVVAFPATVTPSTAAVLSIGTGVSVTAVHGKHHNWGLARWAPHLIPLLFDSTEASINMNMQMLLQDRFHRLDSVLPEPLALDAVARLDDLVAFADVVDIAPAVAFLRRCVVEDTPASEPATPAAEV